MNKISKIILSKLIWVAAAFGVFYVIADPLGWIPQSVKDLVAWFSANFTLIVFLICFLVGAYIFQQFLNRHKGKDQE